MKPSILLDTALAVDDGKPLSLYQHDKDFFIKEGAAELMNSRMHGSEEALAQLACKEIEHFPQPRVLIGGLGMGYTLRAALDILPEDAQVEVVELIPEVVKWNQGVIAHLAGNPLGDKRVTVHQGDVVKKIKEEKGKFGAILLDVDNGPQRLFRKGNDKLYNSTGLYTAYGVLKPEGIFAVWSSGPDKVFSRRLRAVGFEVSELHVNARSGAKAGGHHLIWLAKKPARGRKEGRFSYD